MSCRWEKIFHPPMGGEKWVDWGALAGVNQQDGMSMLFQQRK